MWWMLAREVLRMRGTISRELKWDVMVDLYFYRDPEDVRFKVIILKSVKLCNFNYCYIDVNISEISM